MWGFPESSLIKGHEVEIVFFWVLGGAVKKKEKRKESDIERKKLLLGSFLFFLFG